MTYKIAFFDIDGTLVNEDKQISESTVSAIRQLQARGIPAVIATGRAPYFFRHLTELLGIDSYVSLNGAYAVHRGKPVLQRTIPVETLDGLVRQAAEHGHPLVFEGSDAYFANHRSHPHVTEAVSSLKVELPGYDPDFWRSAPVYQAFLHCKEEDEALYENKLSGLRLVRWHHAAMDVLPAEGSKAAGIDAVLRHLNLSPQEAIAFGDGLNDKEMLALVGLGVAMGNAHDELKPFADYITGSVDEDGIERGLRYAGLL